MALSTADLNGIRALWEEWVPDGFRLDIEVLEDRGHATITLGDSVSAHISAALYCQVMVWTPGLRPDLYPGSEYCVFSERVPHDAGALRASVTVVARTIAERQPLGQ